MALTVMSGSGTQSPSQSNPQASAGNGVPANARQVQPGTPVDVLNSANGLSLNPGQLTTVKFTTAAAPQTSPVKHHVNPVLASGILLLFLVSAWLFWYTAHSGKKHNHYQ